MTTWFGKLLQGRQFGFGRPTPAYPHRVFGMFYVDGHQVGLSARWDTDEAGRDVLVKVGPVGMMLTVARRELGKAPGQDKATLKVLRSKAGREFSWWRNWRHLGVCVEVYPPAQMLRVEVGPFGAAVLSD